MSTVMLVEGTELGPLPVALSAAANDRYWAGAGVEHAARDAGVLYPPMAANLTILLVQTQLATPLLHTAHRLESHARGVAPAALVVTGSVTERFAKRGREYLVVESVVSLDDEPLWSSVATFTPVAS